MRRDDTAIALNTLAREQMKYRLLRDIKIDIEVCKLEGIDYKKYLKELKNIIDGFLKTEQGIKIMKYEKELIYIDKQLKKSKISLNNAVNRNDKTAIENLKNTIAILENIKNCLETSNDKSILNCPMCGRMYEVNKEHKCRKD